MKTTAALSLALAGSAMAAGAADTVNQVLSDINTGIKSFDSAIKAYTGGDASAVNAAASKIGQLTTDGAAKIAAGADLTLNDAVSITTNVQGLQTTLDSALSDLEGIGSKLASAGQCGTIKSQLASQNTAAKALQDAIANKAPAETKAIAVQLGGKVGASIQATAGKFDTICAGAPSGGSSSGSAPPPSGGTSGTDHSGHGSSSAAPASPSAPATASKPKGAASSTAPKPAQYTGSASTLNAARALGLGAVAAFFAL